MKQHTRKKMGVKLNRFLINAALEADKCQLNTDSQFSLQSMANNIGSYASALTIVVIAVINNNNQREVYILGLDDRDRTALDRTVNRESGFFAVATDKVIIKCLSKSMQLLHHIRVPGHSIF